MKLFKGRFGMRKSTSSGLFLCCLAKSMYIENMVKNGIEGYSYIYFPKSESEGYKGFDLFHPSSDYKPPEYENLYLGLKRGNNRKWRIIFDYPFERTIESTIYGVTCINDIIQEVRKFYIDMDSYVQSFNNKVEEWTNTNPELSFPYPLPKNESGETIFINSLGLKIPVIISIGISKEKKLITVVTTDRKTL